MESKRWKNDVAYAMTIFKILTWPIGVWPLQSYNVCSLVRWVLAIFCMSMMVVLPSMEFHMGCTDAEQNIDCLMLIFCGLLAMLKTICFRIYADNLAKNYAAAINDYLNVERTEERFVMRRHAYISRILACSMVFFAYFASVVYALIPLLGDDSQQSQINVTEEEVVLEYTIPSRCALEFIRAPASMHRIFCIVESVMMLLTSTCNHGNDSLFLNITLHICGQIKILRDNFVNFDVRGPEVNHRLNMLIQRHIHLMILAKKLADAISFVLLIQFFLSSILLCIMGFQFLLALKVNDIVLMGKSLMVLSSFIVQLTVYSFVGDYLKSQMEEVGYSIYKSVWYVLPANMTRDLIFITMRAQSPVKLQAGNYIVVNLTTYMSILKTSASYLSVLRVMLET